MLSIRQDYERDIERLVAELHNLRITGEQYRKQVSIRRAQFFADDNAVSC
jgi:hypothetical protein